MAVYIPQKKVNNGDNSFFGQIAKPVGLAGALAGLAAPFTGGASLALGAASAGANLAGQAHQANLAAQAPGAPKPMAGAPEQQSDAITRKYHQELNNPATQIDQGMSALQRLGPDVQQEYGPILNKARMKIGRV